jgi:hypothetical protein
MWGKGEDATTIDWPGRGKRARDGVRGGRMMQQWRLRRSMGAVWEEGEDVTIMAWRGYVTCGGGRGGVRNQGN